jgi:hypothetical protein
MLSSHEEADQEDENKISKQLVIIVECRHTKNKNKKLAKTMVV